MLLAAAQDAISLGKIGLWCLLGYAQPFECILMNSGIEAVAQDLDKSIVDIGWCICRERRVGQGCSEGEVVLLLDNPHLTTDRSAACDASATMGEGIVHVRCFRWAR